MGAMKYCDLVMKGGITSGIVYPNAVLALCGNFRFKNIGGTSAGAIAAGATAAAALGDRRKVAGAAIAWPRGEVGFEGLKIAADQLATYGFMKGLVQPAPGGRNALTIMLTLAGSAGAGAKLLALLSSVPLIAPLETMSIILVLAGLSAWIAGWPGLFAALFPALLCAIVGGAVFAAARVFRVIRRNMFGLCPGLQQPGFDTEQPALTDWLYLTMQKLAGKAADDPLTFTDLWTGERYPDEPVTPNAIELQIITTGVSHHEPRTLPFARGEFWFRRDTFDQLFPRVVVDWMAARDPAPVTVGGVTHYRLPPGSDLPVIVAVRMSLSFPLLYSAVPLFEPDDRKPPLGPDPLHRHASALANSVEALSTGGERHAGPITGFRISWFSDGGISSNFPLQLFDTGLPRWPAFAINLVYPDTDDTDDTDATRPGTAPTTRFGSTNVPRHYQKIASRFAVPEVMSFLFGIMSTMQNWRDLVQARSPGERDRIVNVTLAGNEGGMNIDMSQPVLDAIVKKGTAAGQALQHFSFERHYWVRWRNLATTLQRYTIEVADSIDYAPKIAAYEPAYATVANGEPPPHAYNFPDADTAQAAQTLYAELADTGRRWRTAGPDFSLGTPQPPPAMHITATY